MKIGVFGGAFDPVTKGHLEAAEFVLKHTDLDRIWLMPVPTHPWGKQMAPYQNRQRMIQLALTHHDPRITWSDYERNRKLSGKTWETLRSLQRTKSHKGDVFYWIIGSDEADSIRAWSHIDWLRKHGRFIVVPRQSRSMKESFKIDPWIISPPNISLMDKGVIRKTSSTAARKAVQDGKKGQRRLRNLVPQAVRKYIWFKKLYLDLTNSVVSC